jgi:hypothetical protein
MIGDYYKAFPDPKIKTITGENAVEEEAEMDDDGGGKPRAKKIVQWGVLYTKYMLLKITFHCLQL